MFRRCARRTLRSTDTLVISLTMPILVMLLFTYVFGGAIAVGGSYLDYVVPGIMLLCTGFGASITATGVCTDMTKGSVDRFRTLPMFRQALAAGHLTEGFARTMAAIAIAVGVAVALGYRPGSGPLGWLAATALISLFVVAITAIAVALGLAASNPEAAGGLTYAITFIPYVSSAFVPTHTMPTWLRTVADHQPATPVVDTIRSLLDGTPADRTAPAILWCTVIAAIGFTCAAVSFRRLNYR
ncbi:ABC transporter permease [Nocardia seriolae]|nr:ABC transporter permease [Nocardia seriolae]MTJ71160.1 ABC transporter permease [Nocardia seriolae]MTJ88915.1 ABC transporter permease [Nocardia seriolae]MTK32894.1 ABC transporter permease [Nocardia seriolae]MTK41176.1 ABC transporter permease [Nocardia seriolae]